MSNDGLIVRVEGRDALPVRAIPFVTCWTISPDAVALEFSGKSGPPFAELEGVQPLHTKQGLLVPTLEREWDRIVFALQGLDAEIRSAYPNDVEGYAHWRDLSAMKLPPGVFVWRNEFEAAYLSGTRSQCSNTLVVRHGDHPLTYTPMLSDEVHDALLEGFLTESHDAPHQTTAENRQWYSGRISIQELSWNIASVLADANPQDWNKEGSNYMLRRDIATASVQIDVAKSIRRLVESRHINPTNHLTGRPVDDISQWDDSWLLTHSDTVLIRQAMPLTIETKLQPFVEDAATSIETRRVRERQQVEAKSAAGRLTLQEVAAKLAKNTDIHADRWRRLIGADVRAGKLRLRNPDNLSDNLPYTPPKPLFLHSYEQTCAEDVNAWLDANPDWKVAYRIEVTPPRKAPVEAKSAPIPSQRALATDAINAPLGRQAWQEQEILRLLATLGHDPMLLPPVVSGKAGVKRHVFLKCTKETPKYWVGTVFEKAWERLQQRGEIKYSQK